MRRISKALGIFAVLFAGMHAASAATNYTWTKASGGDWGTTTNWNPNGTPGTGDSVYTKTAGTYTITSTMDRTVHIWYALSASPNVTLDFNGHTLMMGEAGTGATTSSYQAVSGQTTFTDGVYNVTGAFNAGGANSSNGNTILDGSTTTMNLSGHMYLGYVANTFATVTVQNGAKLTTGANNNYLGRSAGSTAFVEVKGAGSTMDIGTGATYIGDATGATATLKVSNGGTLKNGANLFVGTDNPGTGVAVEKAYLLIEDAGSSYTNASGTYIGVGGASTVSYANVAAQFSVHDSATFSTGGGIYNWHGGSVYIGSGSSTTTSLFYNNPTNDSAEKAATLMGSGTILATSNNSHGNTWLYGIVKPGDTLSDSGVATVGTGTLTFGDGSHTANVKLSQNTSITMDFTDATHYDKIAVVGSIAKGDSGIAGVTAATDLGTLILNFDFTPASNTQYNLITTTTGFSGSFSSIVWNGAPEGTFGISGDGKTFYIVTGTVVPEPSSVALLFASAALICFVVRRRRPNGR